MEAVITRGGYHCFPVGTSVEVLGLYGQKTDYFLCAGPADGESKVQAIYETDIEFM